MLWLVYNLAISLFRIYFHRIFRKILSFKITYMKQQIIFWLFAILFLANCSKNPTPKSSEFLNTDNLETQRFLIES